MMRGVCSPALLFRARNLPLGGKARQLIQNRPLFWPPSLLPNKGSVIRDVLAAERTFLAWARTGLGFVGAGSALSAAYYRQHSLESAERTLPASSLLIANGALLLLFATRRYTQVIRNLTEDMFPVDPWSALGVVVITGVNTTLAIYIVWKAEIEEAYNGQELDNLWFMRRKNE